MTTLKTITYAIILILVAMFVGLTLVSPEMPKNWYPSVTMEELYD